jgi:lipopolysaccharide export system permease protein
VRHAQTATYLGDKQWLLEGINITEVSEQKVRALYQQKTIWQSAIKPDLLDIIVVSPENLSLYDLATYIGFLNDNNQKSEVFELAFWGRLINPFITIVMLLVSAPFVLGFNRAHSTGPRMVIGILFGMSFNIFDTIFSNMGLVYDLNPVLVAVFPSAVVLSGAVYAISRLR